MTIPIDMMTEEWMDEFERNFSVLSRSNAASSSSTDTTAQDKSRTETTPQLQIETESCTSS